MVDMVPVDFDGGRAPAAVSQSAVDAAFATRGYTPPPAYARFAVASGGKRFPSAQRYVRNLDSGEPIGITTVYHYDPSLQLYSVQDIWAQTSGQLPQGLVPIASTEFSGEICLDYRQSTDRPAVVLYDYEAEPGEEIGRIADSFDAFVSSIGPKPAE